MIGGPENLQFLQVISQSYNVPESYAILPADSTLLVGGTSSQISAVTSF